MTKTKKPPKTEAKRDGRVKDPADKFAKLIQIKLTTETHRAAKEIATAHGLTMSELVRMMFARPFHIERLAVACITERKRVAKELEARAADARKQNGITDKMRRGAKELEA